MSDLLGRGGYPLDVSMIDGQIHMARSPGNSWGDTVIALCGRTERRRDIDERSPRCAECDRLAADTRGPYPSADPELTPDGHRYRAVDTATLDVQPISEALAERYRMNLSDQFRVERAPVYVGPWEPFVRSPTASEPAGVSEPRPVAGSPGAGPRAPLEIRAAELSVLDLKPGDTIVLRTAGELDEADCESIRSALQEALPPGHQVLIIQGALELSLLHPEKKRKPVPCPTCPHSPGAHYPKTGCIRCTCRHGRVTAPPGTAVGPGSTP